MGEGFRLSIAPDADSPASASEGTTYPATDEGILEKRHFWPNGPWFHLSGFTAAVLAGAQALR
jgi:hypothetical protein